MQGVMAHSISLDSWCMGFEIGKSQITIIAVEDYSLKPRLSRELSIWDELPRLKQAVLSS